MEDYRFVQLAELQKKIEETQTLLTDPSLAELAQEELARLQQEKKDLEDTMRASEAESEDDSLDERNVILDISGAAGGEEAKLWADELIRMYTRFSQLHGYTVETLDDRVIKISGKKKWSWSF